MLQELKGQTFGGAHSEDSVRLGHTKIRGSSARKRDLDI